jgi:hypothetical protein
VESNPPTPPAATVATGAPFAAIAIPKKKGYNTMSTDVWEDIIDIITADDEGDEDEDEEECTPVPPVPAGYPTDRAMIYTSYGETFIAIDRRDGEMVICNKSEISGQDDSVIHSPARALALYRFFWSNDMVELMEYHRKGAA